MPHALVRPESNEYAPFYADYVSRVAETDALTALETQITVVRSTFGAIPESRGGYRYAAGKWSIREIVGHLSDAERIFGYRALRFGRNDPTELPGFEENDYAAASPADQYPLADLVDEWTHLRQANVYLFRQFQPEAWTRSGVASGARVTVRALGFIMVGHARHHLEVLATRYA